MCFRMKVLKLVSILICFYAGPSFAQEQKKECKTSLECLREAVKIVEGLEEKNRLLNEQILAFRSEIEAVKAAVSIRDVYYLGTAISCKSTPFRVPSGINPDIFTILATNETVTSLVEAPNKNGNNAIQEVKIDTTLSADKGVWSVYPKTVIGYANQSGSYACAQQPNPNYSMFHIFALRS